ncbi:MAG: MMPL family transporter, partial [Deltaproteobacteria bacterium]|nr:MMPL family transporter [Deltaproteobacteria bacterium]
MTGELMGERAPLLGERTKRWIIRRAPFVLLVTAGIFVASLSQIVDLRTGQPLLLLDPSVDGMLPSEDEGRAFYEDVKQLFSAGEVVLLALVADDIFTFDNLTRLQTIGEEIEQLDQVDRVTSLSLSLNIRSEDGALVTEPFYDSVPSAPDELADLRSRALSDPIYAGNLVSKDGRVALVVVHLLDIPEQEILASGIDDRVREIASASWRDGEFWMSGGIHVRAEMSRLMLRDSTHVVPISALVMALIAFVAFRTLRGVAIPVLTVAISALATMAFVAMAYGSLNQLTVAVPSVMIVVGFAYSIHIVSAYYDAVRELRGPGATQMSPALMALHEVAAPTLFTGLTTAAGFGSLATSSLASIQQYGIATSVGVVITMIVTLTFSPALLELLPIPASVRQPRTHDRIDQSLAKLARFDIRNRVPILIAGGVVALLSAVGLSQIVVGSDLVG